MTRTYEEITPEKAKEILKGNRGNRRISTMRVAQLVRMMENGEWREDPDIQDSIQIANTGRLLDGQHRLWAIINHGKPVKMWVTRGVSESIMPYIDNSKGRGVNDHLVAMGVEKNDRASGPGRFMLSLLCGASFTNCFSGLVPAKALNQKKIHVDGSPLKKGQVQISTVEVTNFIADHSEFFHAVAADMQRLCNVIGPKTPRQGVYAFVTLAIAAGYGNFLHDFIDDMKDLQPSFWAAWGKDAVRKNILSGKKNREEIAMILSQAFYGSMMGIDKKQPKANYDVPLKVLIAEAKTNWEKANEKSW